MIKKLKKWLKEALTMLGWALLIVAILALFVMSVLNKTGFRWGPGS